MSDQLKTIKPAPHTYNCTICKSNCNQINSNSARWQIFKFIPKCILRCLHFNRLPINLSIDQLNLSRAPLIYLAELCKSFSNKFTIFHLMLSIGVIGLPLNPLPFSSIVYKFINSLLVFSSNKQKAEKLD